MLLKVESAAASYRVASERRLLITPNDRKALPNNPA
jgi:hypothetical protein